MIELLRLATSEKLACHSLVFEVILCKLQSPYIWWSTNKKLFTSMNSCVFRLDNIQKMTNVLHFNPN